VGDGVFRGVRAKELSQKQTTLRFSSEFSVEDSPGKFADLWSVIRRLHSCVILGVCDSVIQLWFLRFSCGTSRGPVCVNQR
jgi:hypothetical protein